MKLRPILAALMASVALAGPAMAADLKIGLSAESSAIDPHYHNFTPNNSLRAHIFDGLIGQDARQKLMPGLAESWRPIGDAAWEFKLRKGVTFSDGSAFTAQDFIYTVCRIPQVANSPSSLTLGTKGIEDIETPDPHTLIIKTGQPYPLLPQEMSTFGIISAKAAGGQNVTFDKAGCKADSWPTTAQFNDGSLAIGTGPYVFAEYLKGERIVLKRNPGYWGPKPAWDQVIFRPIPEDGPRVAALLAGDVDLIENPPLQDVGRLEKEPNVALARTLSNRVIYLALHVGETPRSIQGTDGKNPLGDRRVREALSLSLDRQAIVKRIMLGIADPATQFLPAGFFGHNPAITQERDPKRAKDLLAEAGWPNGFQLTLGAPNDRYVNDEKVAQAVAQMFTRIGVQTQVDANTASVFFSQRNKGAYSAFLAGWSTITGDTVSPLKSLVATRNKDKGLGTTNYSEYSNPTLDSLLFQALATIDDTRREALLKETMKVAMDDVVALPLHYEVTLWAMRKGLSYEARADQSTLAHMVLPKE